MDINGLNYAHRFLLIIIEHLKHMFFHDIYKKNDPGRD